jgi:hypothetical protein
MDHRIWYDVKNYYEYTRNTLVIRTQQYGSETSFNTKTTKQTHQHTSTVEDFEKNHKIHAFRTQQLLRYSEKT